MMTAETTTTAPKKQRNNKAAKHMESKIQVHTVSPPHTRPPLTTLATGRF